MRWGGKKVETIKNNIHTFFQKCMAFIKHFKIRSQLLN
jgi:hypothetical protein